MQPIKNNYGFEALVWVANHYQKSVTTDQLMHSIGMHSISPTHWDLRESAHILGYETALSTLEKHELSYIPLPALVYIQNRWFILTNDNSDNKIILSPETNEYIEKLNSIYAEAENVTTSVNALVSKKRFKEAEQVFENSMVYKSFYKCSAVKSYIGILKKLDEKRKGGAHKAPDLYTFDQENYFKILENGINNW